MDVSQISDMMREAVLVAVKLCAPMLILSMFVGILVAIFQAVTQIHEQTLSFIFKLIVIILVCVGGGGWMMDTLLDFTRYVFTLMAG